MDGWREGQAATLHWHFSVLFLWEIVVAVGYLGQSDQEGDYRWVRGRLLFFFNQRTNNGFPPLLLLLPLLSIYLIKWKGCSASWYPRGLIGKRGLNWVPRRVDEINIWGIFWSELPLELIPRILISNIEPLGHKIRFNVSLVDCRYRL